jgi:two-component system, NtrC family, sensor histidine kinase HydH
MDQTNDENGVTNRFVRPSSKNGPGVKPRLRSIPGGLQADHNHSQQRAQMRRFTTLLNTTALFAHEVASPLQGMSASLQLIESGLQTSHDALLTTTLHTFKREIDRLIVLLNEFRAASAPQTLHLTGSDLRQVIEEALALQLVLYRNAGVGVQLDFEDNLPTVNLEPGKIKQVILNLCKNALDAMPNGGELSIRCYSVDANVILEIADSGIGMREGLDPFALFKTTKIAGSGLGLPIVEQIVLAHNGTIDYSSEPGRGTTFRVVFRGSLDSTRI